MSQPREAPGFSRGEQVTSDQDTWKRVEARQAVMAGRIAELEHALTDVLNSYEDERARIKAGNADKPSVSGQTFIDRARRLLRSPS